MYISTPAHCLSALQRFQKHPLQGSNLSGFEILPRSSQRKAHFRQRKIDALRRVVMDKVTLYGSTGQA